LAALAVIAALILYRVAVWALGARGPKPVAAIPVTAVTATASDVPIYLEGLGTVRATNTVTVRSRVDGQLVDVAFKEGQTVAKGDVLAEIDPRPFKAQVETAAGNLARDQANLENARRDLARYQELAKSGYAAQQRVDTQAATVNALAASVRADEGALRNARVQLGYTTIKAPIDGRTGIRQIDAGNIIHATDPNGLVVITQVQPITAVFTIPQKDLAQVLAAGDPTTLKVTALNSERTAALDHGTLELIDNTIDQTTGTVRLKATFPNAKNTLWPGEFVNVQLQTGTAHGGVTIPSRAVQRGPNGPYIYVVKADDTVEMRSLAQGQEHDGRTLVTKGLAAGERVVTDGTLSLTTGVKVRIANAQSDNGGDEKSASASQDALK
jgi:multidrug efflux system membrane fusion protein